MTTTQETPKQYTVADALYMCRGKICAYAQIAEIQPDQGDCLSMQQDLNPRTDERICGLAAQAMLCYGEDKEMK